MEATSQNTVSDTPTTTQPPRGDALYFEYSQAADPIGLGVIPLVPYAEFPASLHETGPTRVVALDLSQELRCAGPATSPSLCASYVRILASESIRLHPNASSQVHYVMRGRGTTRFGGQSFSWSAGDVLALPAGGEAHHEATEDAAFYWVHDEPMLRYVGARATEPTFRPTLYPSKDSLAELAKAEADPEAHRRSRVSVLLANRACPETRTITPTLWTMLGILPAGKVQAPHRHESVALDFIIDAKPGCYSLVGTERDDRGAIVNGKRVDWQSQSVFVTPPGYWHSHHNESSAPARLLPIQDAGLHTYLRTLDIRFSGAR